MSELRGRGEEEEETEKRKLLTSSRPAADPHGNQMLHGSFFLGSFRKPLRIQIASLLLITRLKDPSEATECVAEERRRSSSQSHSKGASERGPGVEP